MPVVFVLFTADSFDVCFEMDIYCSCSPVYVDVMCCMTSFRLNWRFMMLERSCIVTRFVRSAVRYVLSPVSADLVPKLLLNMHS